MDELSLNESLMILLVDRDDVDGTNVLTLFHNAQNELITAYDISPDRAARWLDQARSYDEVDGILIYTTRNGQEDIFA